MPKSQILTGVLLITIIFFIALFYLNVENRNDSLTNNSFITICVIEKLKPFSFSSSTKTGKNDAVYFYFVKNDTVFHKNELLKRGQIKDLELKTNQYFEIRISNSDYEVFEIDYKKKKDTIIDKNDHKIQIYNSIIHQNLIE
ncbi:hypothetical protein [Aurantibacter sp.]|uniref:hypothetical protein n=1 Tax=Aurantibacter sp. TaxID=2807103 RepID=UPI0035C83AA7